MRGVLIVTLRAGVPPLCVVSLNEAIEILERSVARVDVVFPTRRHNRRLPQLAAICSTHPFARLGREPDATGLSDSPAQETQWRESS